MNATRVLLPPVTLLFAALLTALVAGCEAPPPAGTAGNEAAPPPLVRVDPDSPEAAELAAARAKMKADAARKKNTPAKDTGEAPAAGEPSPAAKEPAPKGKLEKVEALTDAGTKGKYKPGFITAPLTAYWGAAERIAKNQIFTGLKHFKAEHDRLPKDFAELDDKIIKPAAVVLRKLPEGHLYVYDPKRGTHGELLVLVPEGK